MVRARYGRIVNISSVTGGRRQPGQATTPPPRPASSGAASRVAKELARRNITCNVIAPGFITTDMTDVWPDKIKEEYKQIIPCRRFGEPADVAAPSVFDLPRGPVRYGPGALGGRREEHVADCAAGAQTRPRPVCVSQQKRKGPARKERVKAAKAQGPDSQGGSAVTSTDN